MIAWINTLTLHSLTLVIFRKNKLDPHLIFEEIAQEFKKKKAVKNLVCEGEKTAASRKRQFPTLYTKMQRKHSKHPDTLLWQITLDEEVWRLGWLPGNLALTMWFLHPPKYPPPPP